MLGSLIAAGGSILGGLLGGEERQNSRGKSKTKSRSTTTNDVHLRKMVRTAERNGFNPLTLLRAGGLAAFTDTSTTGKSKTKSRSRGSSSSSSPMAAGIAGAASAIGGAMAQGPSAESEASANAWQMPSNAPIPASNPRAEYDLLQAQLGGVKYGTLGTQPSVPVSTTYKSTPALAAAGVAGADGGFVQPTYEAPTVTNPFPQDSGLKVDPLFPDATERYESEAFQTGFDIWRAKRDIQKNVVESDWYKELGDLWDTTRRAPITDIKGVPAISTNVWDPPAISMTSKPVVTDQYVPPLRYRPGEESTWW